jgi:Cu-Zn family superoxide dismutase
MKHWKSLASVVVAMAVASAGCDSTDKDAAHAQHQPDNKPVAAAAQAADAAKVAVAHIEPSEAATTQPTLNHVTGTVTFTQVGDAVKVVADINGLTPDTTHGFHIHEKGDLSAPDLSSAGPHFNPAGHHHGSPADADASHAGDLGNITADANGYVHHEVTSEHISLGDGPNSVIGRSVLVHEKADDLKSDPSGNSGSRIAGGVIEAEKQ